MPKTGNIIISADDFGKSELANRNILLLAEARKIDRVSVMADGNFNVDEIGRIKKSGVKLDIHLELAWQKKRRRKIKDNTVRQGIIFLVNHFRSSRRKNIQEEWENQIEKFCNIFGQHPDGINSHEYVHLFPAYFKIALDLAKKFDVPYIRFAKRALLGENNMARTILSNLRRWNKKNFSASNLESSDYFVSFDWMKKLDKHLINFPKEEIEIACHPEREEEFNIINKFI
jgi:chitin disaccharide deacetylase